MDNKPRIRVLDFYQPSLQENTLYTTDAEKQALLADKDRVALAFVYNFLGMLGLIRAVPNDSAKNFIFRHLKTDKQLRIQNIGDDNLDISLSVKLASDAGLFRTAQTVNDITRFLAKVKLGQVDDIDSLKVAEWVDGLVTNFHTYLKIPGVRAAFVDFRNDAGKTLDISRLAIVLRRNATKVDVGGDFVDLSKRFYPLVQRQPLAVQQAQVATAAAANTTVSANTSASSNSLTTSIVQTTLTTIAPTRHVTAAPPPVPVPVAPPAIKYPSKKDKEETFDIIVGLISALSNKTKSQFWGNQKALEKSLGYTSTSAKSTISQFLKDNDLKAEDSFPGVVTEIEKLFNITQNLSYYDVRNMKTESLRTAILQDKHLSEIFTLSTRPFAFTLSLFFINLIFSSRNNERLTDSTAENRLIDIYFDFREYDSITSRFSTGVYNTFDVLKTLYDTFSDFRSHFKSFLITYYQRQSPSIVSNASYSYSDSENNLAILAVVETSLGISTHLEKLINNMKKVQDSLDSNELNIGWFCEVFDVTSDDVMYKIKNIQNTLVPRALDGIKSKESTPYDIIQNIKTIIANTDASQELNALAQIKDALGTRFGEFDKIENFLDELSDLSYYMGNFPRNSNQTIQQGIEDFISNRVDAEIEKDPQSVYNVVVSGIVPRSTYLTKRVSKSILKPDAQTGIVDPANLDKFYNLVKDSVKENTKNNNYATTAYKGNMIHQTMFTMVSSAIEPEQKLSLYLQLLKDPEMAEYTKGVSYLQVRGTFSFDSSESDVIAFVKAIRDSGNTTMFNETNYKDAKLWKPYNLSVNESKAEYVQFISEMMNNCIDTDMEDWFNDEILENMSDNMLYVVRQNLVGANKIVSEINDNVIKPFHQLDKDIVKKMIHKNDIDFNTIVSGQLPRKKKGERWVDYVKRARDWANTNAAAVLPPLKVTETTESPRKATAVFNNIRAGKHGSIHAKVIKVFDAHVKFPEFEEFRKNNFGDGEIVPAFHGTGGIAATMILRFGFKVIKSTDPSVVGRMLGDGIYFANHVDKSLQYVSNNGYGRSLGEKGYIFELENNLGKKGRGTNDGDYAVMGLGNDGIRSPEWCVRDAKAQTAIKKVYEVELVSPQDAKEWALIENKLMTPSFKSILNESRSKGDYEIRFRFRDGAIPIIGADGNVTYVDFQKAIQKKLIPDDMVDFSDQGPVVVFRKMKVSLSYDFRFATTMSGRVFTAYSNLFDAFVPKKPLTNSRR